MRFLGICVLICGWACATCAFTAELDDKGHDDVILDRCIFYTGATPETLTLLRHELPAKAIDANAVGVKHRYYVFLLTRGETHANGNVIWSHYVDVNESIMPLPVWSGHVCAGPPSPKGGVASIVISNSRGPKASLVVSRVSLEDVIGKLPFVFSRDNEVGWPKFKGIDSKNEIKLSMGSNVTSVKTICDKNRVLVFAFEDVSGANDVEPVYKLHSFTFHGDSKSWNRLDLIETEAKDKN